MAPAASVQLQPRTPSCGSRSRFLDLRGVRWRIDLGILPCSPSNSIEDLRRATADARRRYANLRRRLLINPHLSKDGSTSPDRLMDNPLSQDPDSNWGRYFKNTELEKMVDQDLSRLYPEHGGYFQTPACQAMLRRILLMWCLRNPECGYRQGMHELLAPLLYVLYDDVQRLSEVRKSYEDYFNDDFDEVHIKTSRSDSEAHGSNCMTKPGSLDELDSETRDIFMLSDAYGAEGELGAIISERFMEHDAYCMLDQLMNGDDGGVEMADFFAHSSYSGSISGLQPVIEASLALYHLLSVVDPSLRSHLVELGVEPQYFALRWLRVLFGREFSLENLLIIWDEIFISQNCLVAENGSEYKILRAPRGAFIAGIAVSMLLHLRSSLLATEYAASCLQRLLNFPEDVDVKKLIEKAKSLQFIVLETNFSSSSPRGSIVASKIHKGDSYWEEKWRVLHCDEALSKGTQSYPSQRAAAIQGSMGRRYGLYRTGSDPAPSKADKSSNNIRRRLIGDLSRELSYDADDSTKVALGSDRGSSDIKSFIISQEEENEKNLFSEEAVLQNVREDSCPCGESSSVFSEATSPNRMGSDLENESERSSITSIFSVVVDNVDERIGHVDDEPCQSNVDDEVPSRSAESRIDVGDATQQGSKGGESPTESAQVETNQSDSEGQASAPKERKPSPGRFQWFWKLGKGSAGHNQEKDSDGGATTGVKQASGKDVSGCSNTVRSSDSGGSTTDSSKSELADKNMLNTLKNIGQSMLENIQVIESAFQQGSGQAGVLENLPANILGGKGQLSAMAALKELRKISNLMSEM